MFDYAADTNYDADIMYASLLLVYNCGLQFLMAYSPWVGRVCMPSTTIPDSRSGIQQ